MTLPGEGEREFDQMQFRQELAAMDVEQLTALLSKTDRRSDFLKFTLVREELADRRRACARRLTLLATDDRSRPPLSELP